MGNDPSFTLSLILFRTLVTTRVLPVPGFPYTSKLDGRAFFNKGNSDWVTFFCSSSLCNIVSGTNVKCNTSLFLNKDFPLCASSNNLSIESFTINPHTNVSSLSTYGFYL